MNRRFFMRALAASLGFFSFGKWVQAEETVFKYSKFFRRADQATMDEFKGMVYINDNGQACGVPLIWCTDQKADAIYQMEHQPIKLPFMNIYRGDIFFNGKIHSYYHLTMRGMYEEHMNQMLEQAVVKFHPKFKNKVGEYNLMSLINDYYPGGSHTSAYPLAECNPVRGEIYSAAKWGEREIYDPDVKWGSLGEWITFKKGDMVEGTPRRRVLKHQLNMILVMEGKP